MTRNVDVATFAAAFLLAAAFTPMAALAQTVPVQLPASDLTGVTWTWLRSEYADDSIVVAANPRRYTLEFHADGLLRPLAGVASR